MNLVRKKIAKFGGLEAFGLVFIKDFANSALSQRQIGLKLSIEAVGSKKQAIISLIFFFSIDISEGQQP